MSTLNGLSIVNIELTNRCNKECWMCTRRKTEEIYKNYKDIDFKFLDILKRQIPDGVTIQFHSNGEPTLYHKLRDALNLFSNNIRSFDTNGKLLIDKFDDIADNLETIAVSTFENDSEADEQYVILKKFLDKKGIRKPNVVIRCLGNIEPGRFKKYEDLGCIIAKRVFHSSQGSFEYKKDPVIPEIGICLEILSKLVIDVDGYVSPCVRFDPKKELSIGNIMDQTLEEIWNSEKRKYFLKQHVSGNRKNIAFCGRCEFWGIPRG